MPMSKKDFIELADVIREHNRIAQNRAMNQDDSGEPFTFAQVEALADFCKRSNSAFKRERWLSYINGECGPNGGNIKR